MTDLRHAAQAVVSAWKAGELGLGIKEFSALEAALAAQQALGEIVVTHNQSGQIVAVTRQDEEGRILSVIAESAQQAAQPVAWCDDGALAGGVGSVASAATKQYWARGDRVDRDTAARLKHPLYAAAQPQQAADELGWLIEMQFGDGLLWWSGCFDDDGTYPPSRLIARMVNDVNKAVRFSRREDAQRVLDAMLAAQPCPLLARAKTLYSVHEHMWPEAAQPQQAEPSRSQKMRDAGFTPRDTRLECDECGQKVTAQFMPIHKCAQQAAQPVSCQAPLDTSQAAQSVALPDLPTHWTKVTDPDGVEVKVWRAFQMRDFARAAIAAAQPQQATDKIGGAA